MILNDIGKLTDKILAESKQYAAQTLEAAKAEAGNILDGFRREANFEAKAIIDAAEMAAAGIARRNESQAGIDARSIKLAGRRRMLDVAFVEAIEELKRLPAEKMIDFLADLAATYQTSDAVMIFNAADAKAIGKAVVDRVCEKQAERKLQTKLAEETRDFAGGFILKEDNIETNCTFEILVKGVTDSMEAEVAKILFEAQ